MREGCRAPDAVAAARRSLRATRERLRDTLVSAGISWIRSHEEARLKVQQQQLAEKLAARNPEEAGEEDEAPVATSVEIKTLRRVRAESSHRPPRHRRDAGSMA